ncbi:type 1 glutamine amidotransferase domain-containing protein [Streptomyces tubercidicus]|uniref:type 1 glutamine amidotransferase domain-containing protein n=1 Tax=Streptomyces tubercidicus TaxID=47759 RepID=UPI002E123D3E|nr:type 1 glutamine amidotransferase domain-containing protein [Streptomyces tubercidicus]WSX24483.1 type 1 glutamine amidotransferase domain-containing protein [Streptomyces tubercidicus]
MPLTPDASAPSVLLAVTGTPYWTLSDGTKHPCGYWPEELAVPHRIFREAGLCTAIGTPGGVRPTPDPAGLTDEWAGYLDSLGPELTTPLVIEDLADSAGRDSYDAVFVPGGHGPLEDLAHSAPVGLLMRRMHAAGKPVAAVCHGPAALLPAREDDGSWTFAGFRLTAFSNEEETEFGLADRAPFLTEDRLKEYGAVFSTADTAWGEHIVVDRGLYTGQNPASAGPLAHRVVEALTTG